MTNHSNWGGKRPNAGRPRQFIKVPATSYIQRSEQEQIPESDLLICLAENQYDAGKFDRGIVIDEIWYDAREVLAIARFIEANRPWLESGIE